MRDDLLNINEVNSENRVAGLAENNYSTKEKIVMNDGSKVFKNWNQFGMISKNEFLEALKWVCMDPMDNGRITRKIGLEVTKDMTNKILSEKNSKFANAYNENNLKGRIVRLYLVNNAYYDADSREFKGLLNAWDGRITISCRDRI